MFWNYGNTSSSQIEAVLAKKDVTLQELMDEEDIINECKVQNKTLMEFLVKPDIIEELITLTTLEPSTEIDESARFKYSNIACEILTCDVPRLNERLASDEALLSKLYGFIDCEPPLNPLLASFFSKIMGVLIARKAVQVSSFPDFTYQNWLSYQMTCLQVLDFLKAKENFIPMLLKHMGTSAIMDLTLKLMTQVEGAEVRQNNLDWLNGQQLMQSLVSLLDPSVDTERHYNVSQLLCDFIKVTRENIRNSTRPNCHDLLLDAIESPKTVSLLLDHMLSENRNESCIVGGIQVLLALLDFSKTNSNENNENVVDVRPPVIDSTALAIFERLRDFHSLLLDPPKKKSIITTLGVLDPPLGNTRLQITKLFAALISTKLPEIMQELIKLGTFQVLLDLFFQFPWNNFLHTQVQICITSALETAAIYRVKYDNALYEHLIINCKLIERILDAWKYNDVQQTEHNSVRQGYMGHLTAIVEYIDICSTSSLGEFLKDNTPEIAETFKTFCEATLPFLIHNRVLSLASDSFFVIDNDRDFSNADSIFTEYQNHPLTQEIKCTWRHEMDDWKENEDNFIGMDSLRNKVFELAEGISLGSHELFKQVCSQNINTLDDVDDQIFEDRDHTLQTVIEKMGEHIDTVYSSDSEEEEDEEDSLPPDLVGKSNSADKSWKLFHRAVMNAGNVWSNVEKVATDADNSGWANFNSASFANFEVNFDNASNDVQPIVETDLTVENIDINNKIDCAQKSSSCVPDCSVDLTQLFQKTVNASETGREDNNSTCDNNGVSPEVDEQLPIKTSSEGGDCKVDTVPSPKAEKEESEEEGV